MVLPTKPGAPTIKPQENPGPNEAVLEVRLFIGDGKTRIVTAHFQNLPVSHKRRGEHFRRQAGAVVNALVIEYLKEFS